MTNTDIYNISPITYCHSPGYNPLKKEGAPNADKMPLILKAVTDWSGFAMEQLTTKSRKREIVRIRQIAMYLLRWHTNMLLDPIGRLFGGRDHTTVIHSCNTVSDLMCTDAVYRKEVYDLEYRISGIKPYDIPDKPMVKSPVLKIVRPVDIYSNYKSLYP